MQPGYKFPDGYAAYFDENDKEKILKVEYLTTLQLEASGISPRAKQKEKILKVEYLTTLPEAIADFMGKEWPQTSMHQLRAFYGHAKRAEDALRRKLPLAAAVNEIKKLESNANDRMNKDPAKISRTFHDFLRLNAQSVVANDDGETFKAFLQHFQALVGFCAGRLNDKERT